VKVGYSIEVLNKYNVGKTRCRYGVNYFKYSS